MANTPHPDENAIFDLAMARRKIEALFRRDGVIDPDEASALTLIDASHTQLGTSYRRRTAVESWLRNGLTDRTQRLARTADIQFIEDNGQTVITTLCAQPDEPRVAVLPLFPHAKKHRHPGMDDGAA